MAEVHSHFSMGSREHLEVPFGGVLLQLTIVIRAVATSVVFDVIVLHKLCVFLIDAEVGQMNELLTKLLWVQIVLLSCEPDQAVVIDIDFKWIELCDKYVYSQIIL